MDVEAVIDASRAYHLWEQSHPNASKASKNEAFSVSQSKDFQNWIVSNPSGTLEEYMAMRQRHYEYVNSPQYRFDVLESRIEDLEDENHSLYNQIEELQEEIQLHEERESKLDTMCAIFSISTLVLLILSIFLAIRLKRK